MMAKQAVRNRKAKALRELAAMADSTVDASASLEEIGRWPYLSGNRKRTQAACNRSREGIGPDYEPGNGKRSGCL